MLINKHTSIKVKIVHYTQHWPDKPSEGLPGLLAELPHENMPSDTDFTLTNVCLVNIRTH